MSRGLPVDFPNGFGLLVEYQEYQGQTCKKGMFSWFRFILILRECPCIAADVWCDTSGGEKLVIMLSYISICYHISVSFFLHNILYLCDEFVAFVPSCYSH
jgi:hypothetical protein